MKKKTKKSSIELPMWNEKKMYEKVITIVTMILCLAAVVLYLLNIFKVVNYTFIADIILSIIFICEFILYFKTNKKLSFIFLAIAIILLISKVVMLFI